MNILTFDTLKFAKRLEEAGFTERQAETLAEEQAHLVKEQTQVINDSLVTKSHLDLRLGEFEHRLKADILKWMFGGMLGQIAVLAALIKLL